MGAARKPTPLGAVGAFGQNTQTNAIDLPPQFATSAINCFVDESGRLTARKSAKIATDANVDATGAFSRVYRHNKADGTSIAFVTANGRIFSTDTDTLTSRSSGHSADYWQFASLNGKVFAAQSGHSLRYFNETTLAETTQATPSNPRAICEAYGRLWALSSDGWTLSWSDLLDGTNFATGTSGSFDMTKWSTGPRSVGVAIVPFNRQLVILRGSDIAILGLANDLNPNNSTTPIYLKDIVPNVGCLARDSVVTAGEDVLFLSDDGVRSLTRSLQESEGPAPLSELTALNKDTFIRDVIEGNTPSQIAASWHPGQSWYMLFTPTTKEVWVLDMAKKVPQLEKPRTTVWRMENKPLYHAMYWTDRRMYFGGDEYLFTNDVYDSTDDYDMIVRTGWLSLDAPGYLKILKSMLVNIKGGSGQVVTLRWYTDFNETTYRSATFTINSGSEVAEYGIAEYGIAEYSLGVSAATAKPNLSQDPEFVMFEIIIPVAGVVASLNNMQVYSKLGRQV